LKKARTMTPTSSAGDEKRELDREVVKTFPEHLEDLRMAIIKSLAALAVATIVCFCFADKILAVFIRPLEMMSVAGGENANEVVLRALKPQEGFVVSIKASVAAGIIIAAPVIFYQLWSFVSPGLTARERRMTVPVLGCGTLCFFLGVAFCYFVVLRLCLEFLWKYTDRMGIRADWTIGNYMSFVLTLLIAFGIAFEMPVVSALLARLGLLTSETLREKALYAILGIFVFAAILTPPDVVSQILLAVPMVGLYGVSILTAKVMARRAETAQDEDNGG